jgi:hypothetical protein
MLSIYNISYHNIDIRPQLVSESVFDFKFEPVAYCIVKVHRIRNVEFFFYYYFGCLFVAHTA